MTTLAPTARTIPDERSHTPAVRDGTRARRLAGLMLVLAAGVVLLGIITAEAVYSGTYTTHANEISDLGATRPPQSIIVQPAAHTFNTVMIVSGGLILAGGVAMTRGLRARRHGVRPAVGCGRARRRRPPRRYRAPHQLSALVAFVSGAVAAILAMRVQNAPLRYVSLALGVAALVALGFGMAGDATWVNGRIGDGGVERWIAYPVVLWLAEFGAWLSA